MALMALGLVSCAGPVIDPWSSLGRPSPGPAQIHGVYWAGCLEGAVSLNPDGPGYQVMRLSRNRFWAHPALLDFLLSYAAALDKRGLGPLLIGDLSQPRGGPALSGHASHQTGLDADLWFWHPAEAEKRSLTLAERETLNALSMVTPDGQSPVTGLWSPNQVEMLRLAAGYEEVERIFVNPALKRELCRNGSGDGTWLYKIRPWSGHDSHFHVRLRCPGSQEPCQNQEAPALDPGCGEDLEKWFASPPPKPSAHRGLPELPPACSALLAEGGDEP